MKLLYAMFLNILLLSSQSCAMDIVKKIYDRTVTYRANVFQHYNPDLMVFSTQPQPQKKTYNQRAFVYSKDPQVLKQEKILKKVIPHKDGRTRILNTDQWPYSICAQLTLFIEGEEYGGSGSFVGPHHVLTCGHNIYSGKKWTEKILVYPALHENHAPFGEGKVIEAYTFRGWIESECDEFDMALLVLNKSIGEYTGWGGLLSIEDAELYQEEINITGYPGDKGFKQMWGMNHKIKEVKPEQFNYEIDTNGGQSGSPIWINKWGSTPMILGVHTGGDYSINWGVRLSRTKFTNIVNIISDTLILNQITLSSESHVVQEAPFEKWRKSLQALKETWAKDLLEKVPNQYITELNLYGAFFTTKGCEYLVKGRLFSLTTLNLGANPLLNENAESSVALELLANGNLPSLTDLDLSYNSFPDEGIASLANGNLSSLKSLSLYFTRISGKGIIPLGNGNLPFLTKLNLGGNIFYNPEVLSFANMNLPSLNYLILSHTHIGNDGVKFLASGNLSSLTYLDLSHNNIGNEGMEILANGNLPSLTYLDLCWNNFDNRGAEFFTNGKLSSLTKLHLGQGEGMYFRDEIMDALTKKLPNCYVSFDPFVHQNEYMKRVYGK